MAHKRLKSSRLSTV